MFQRTCVVAMVAGLLIGCGAQIGPPPLTVADVSRTFPLSGAQLDDRLKAAYKSAGLRLGDGLSAHASNLAINDWAHCRTVRNTDRSNDSRSRRARPLYRDVVIDAAVTSSGTTSTVRLSARYTQRTMNTMSNHPFTIDCSTTGVLEKMILDTMGSGNG